MAIYNRTKADSRKQETADLTAEIAAIDAGVWPRDIDDAMRWGAGQSFASHADKAAYARRLCVDIVDYLQAIPARIASGELGNGWQA
jgi:hypothetical protein